MTVNELIERLQKIADHQAGGDLPVKLSYDDGFAVWEEVVTFVDLGRDDDGRYVRIENYVKEGIQT